jgi:hypothetical protein
MIRKTPKKTDARKKELKNRIAELSTVTLEKSMYTHASRMLLRHSQGLTKLKLEQVKVLQEFINMTDKYEPLPNISAEDLTNCVKVLMKYKSTN